MVREFLFMSIVGIENMFKIFWIFQKMLIDSFKCFQSR